MSRNLYHTVKRGEVGKVLEFTIEDANGTLDLTDWTVTLTVVKGSTILVDDEVVTKRNQTTNEGEAYRIWDTEMDDAELGKYRGELKLVNGGTTLYWPTNAENARTYFSVEVQAPLS